MARAIAASPPEVGVASGPGTDPLVSRWTEGLLSPSGRETVWRDPPKAATHPRPSPWNPERPSCVVEDVTGQAIAAEAVGWAAAVEQRDVAFEALYRREYVPMLRVAFLLLDAQGPAEEAVHDAFAKVYERWRKVDDHGAYLRTCVVNCCRDVQRRRRLERERRPDPGRSYEELGARELLDALATLPIKQRAAVVLRYYEGLSEADTAAALGVAPGTVKSMVTRALLSALAQRGGEGVGGGAGDPAGSAGEDEAA
jgi:RNA polymerase sigma factor (sigma-70 family)